MTCSGHFCLSFLIFTSLEFGIAANFNSEGNENWIPHAPAREAPSPEKHVPGSLLNTFLMQSHAGKPTRARLAFTCPQDGDKTRLDALNAL